MNANIESKPESLVEIENLTKHFPITQAQSAKVANTFSCWMMQQNRIFTFGRHPHSTPGAVLLEMNFIQGPKVNVIIGSKFSDFF